MSRVIDADALRATVMKILNNSIGGAYDGVYQCLEAINNAPTVEYPEQITVECDTEEDKQKLLSALRNVKLKAIVEDERPHGKWIRQGKGDDCRCSECGCSAMYFSQLDEDEQEVFGTLTTDWCPWCGADMRKETENEQ